jgi:hypothetical protein
LWLLVVVVVDLHKVQLLGHLVEAAVLVGLGLELDYL